MRKNFRFFKRKFRRGFNLFWKKNKIKIDIVSDSSLIVPEYIIDVKNKSKKTIELIENFKILKNLEQQKKAENIIKFKDKKKFKKKPFKKKTYYKKAK